MPRRGAGGALPAEVRRLDVLPLPLRGRGPAAALATPALPGRAQQRAGAKWPEGFELEKRLRSRARFMRRLLRPGCSSST